MFCERTIACLSLPAALKQVVTQCFQANLPLTFIMKEKLRHWVETDLGLEHRYQLYNQHP
jgi:hypothetical protein